VVEQFLDVAANRRHDGMPKGIIARIKTADIDERPAWSQHRSQHTASWVELYLVQPTIRGRCKHATIEALIIRNIVGCSQCHTVHNSKRGCAVAERRVIEEFRQRAVTRCDDGVAVLVIRAEERTNINEPVESSEKRLPVAEVWMVRQGAEGWRVASRARVLGWACGTRSISSRFWWRCAARSTPCMVGYALITYSCAAGLWVSGTG